MGLCIFQILYWKKLEHGGYFICLSRSHHYILLFLFFSFCQKNKNNTPSVIPYVGLGRVNCTQTLPLPHRDREVVSWNFSSENAKRKWDHIYCTNGRGDHYKETVAAYLKSHPGGPPITEFDKDQWKDKGSSTCCRKWDSNKMKQKIFSFEEGFERQKRNWICKGCWNARS